MLMPSIFGEDLFDDFFNDFTRPAKSVARYNTPITNVMRTDVKETEGSYELEIDLPGYKKEDVQAQLKDGYMVITAKQQTQNEEQDKNKKYIRRERFYGSYSRSFYVGEEIIQEDIKASFKDGILKVSVPTTKAIPQVEENRYITIEG